jgi:predicted GNAT family N-acyltransferase
MIRSEKMVAIAPPQHHLAIQVIHELTDLQVQELCHLYQSTWWANHREIDDIRLMIQHSDIIIALCDRQTHQLLGFARVLTDFVYRAVLLDVIVRENCREQGLGRALMDAIVHHPDLRSIEMLALFCLPDVVPFYEKWGFTTGFENLHLLIKASHS